MLPAPHRFRSLALSARVVLWLALTFAPGVVWAADPWPAESWQQAAVFTQLDTDFQNNLSGAYWNPETRTLWVCLNGPGRFWALVEDGSGGLVVDEQGGRRAEWSISGDIEGITQVDPLESAIYVINEAQGAVEKYDVSVYGAPVLLRRWDLSAHVAPVGSAGAEGITFVPDEWLHLAGFTDGDGLPYTSRNGMGGLVLVAHQSGGVVYAFDLDSDDPNAGNSGYDFVGAYVTSRGESSGLEFDRSSGKLFIWHNTGANYLEMSDLTSSPRADGRRQFTTVVEYTGPRSGNLEGIAITPASSGDNGCFLVDDDNQDGGALSWYRDCVLAQVGHDSYTVVSGATLDVVPPGVRANDSGPAAAAVLVGEPSHGRLVGLAPGATFDGSFVYVPDAGFTGVDGFTYRAADGAPGSAEANVVIDVLPGLDPPPDDPPPDDPPPDDPPPDDPPPDDPPPDDSRAYVLEVRVQSANDDAEEASDGSVNLASSDLELTEESSRQTIGVRFGAVDVPRRARIAAAWVQFTVDESAGGSTALTIHGEAAPSAAEFSSAPLDITRRRWTAAFVDWSPPAWAVVGESTTAQRTPDIAAVIQEIVDSGAWEEGNAIALLVTGSGKRVAESYDGAPAAAPLLHVVFEETGTERIIDACTSEWCDPVTGCVLDVLVCDDRDACTVDSCDPGTGCVFAARSCDDGDACTTDACDRDAGCVFAARSCDDGDACTIDFCDPQSGCAAAARSCDDGNACTIDACDRATGCVFAARSCDDGDACTIDVCDRDAGCVYAARSCDDGDPDPLASSGGSSPHLWTGVVETGTGWTHVALAHTYEQMVVVCVSRLDRGMGLDSSRSISSRVVPDTDGKGFEVAASRADAPGLFVAGATMTCTVVEAGVYTQAVHGVTMEAATSVSPLSERAGPRATSPWKVRNAYENPVFLEQVLGVGDLPAPQPALHGLSAFLPLGPGTDVGKPVAEARVGETVAHIVLEAGPGGPYGASWKPAPDLPGPSLTRLLTSELLGILN